MRDFFNHFINQQGFFIGNLKHCSSIFHYFGNTCPWQFIAISSACSAFWWWRWFICCCIGNNAGCEIKITCKALKKFTTSFCASLSVTSSLMVFSFAVFYLMYSIKNPRCKRRAFYYIEKMLYNFTEETYEALAASIAASILVFCPPENMYMQASSV